MNSLNDKVSVLAHKYVAEIEQCFGELEPVVLLYGSSANGIYTSDLDVCIILHQYGDADKEKIKDLTIDFHKKNGLKLDNEVPFEQKCIYSYYDIERLLKVPPFPIFRSKFRIPAIDKSQDYLSSTEVKFRLLLNILTTNSIVIRGNQKIIDIYRQRAWETLIRVVYSYIGNSPVSISQFIEYLCRNPFGEEEGEYFLGYSKQNDHVSDYLTEACKKIFSRLEKEKKLIVNQYKKYSCDKEWLRELEVSAVASSFSGDNYYKLTEFEKMKGHDFSENANPLGPTEVIQDALKQCSVYINVYPDYKNIDANTCLSEFFSVPFENVAIANGSLEAIFALPQMLDTSAPSVVVPTYWGYEAALKAAVAEYNKLYIGTSLEFDDSDINNTASKSSLLYMCNPNNPTSSYMEKERLYKIIQNNKNCHFIIDESHLMLHDNFSSETLSSHVEELGNVSLVYSLSKLFSVAGLRVGALVSKAGIIDKYKKWQVPYSLGTISQVLFPLIIKDTQFVEKTRNEIHVLVQELYKGLCQFDWLNVKPSVTNFILCEIKRGITAVELADKLKEDGFYIRELKTCYPDLEGEWIRISVNTRELNSQLINKIKRYNIF